MKRLFRAIVQGLVNIVQRIRIRRRVKAILAGKEFLEPGHLDINKVKSELRKRYPRIKGNREWFWRKRCEAVRKLIKHHGMKPPPWPCLNGRRVPASPALYSWHLQILGKVSRKPLTKTRGKRPGERGNDA